MIVDGELSTLLNGSGVLPLHRWDVADIQHVSSFFPDKFEITDVIPLTEIILPIAQGGRRPRVPDD